MATCPRVVALDTVFYWDHAVQRLARGTVIDVPEGSSLEAAIGADRLVPLGNAAPPHPVAFGGGGGEAHPSATSNGPQPEPRAAAEPPEGPAPEPAPRAARRVTTPPQRRNTPASRTRKQPGGGHGG